MSIVLAYAEPIGFGSIGSLIISHNPISLLFHSFTCRLGQLYSLFSLVFEKFGTGLSSKYL